MPSPPLGITASHDHFKEATGGAKTTSGGYTVHTFTSSGTFTIAAKGKREIEWEILGGGGAGGDGAGTDPMVKGSIPVAGGGGGGGGYMTGTAVLAPAYVGGAVVTAIPVTIGAGGATSGLSGNPSAFYRDANQTQGVEPTVGGIRTGASGGGNGSDGALLGEQPANTFGTKSFFSGSGGGGAGLPEGVTSSFGGAGFSPNGNNGGDGGRNTGVGGCSGGGGGGAGSVGGAGSDPTGGFYGRGGSGVNGVCGGGGGGREGGTGLSQGRDGGGNGGGNGPSVITDPTEGAANTGGGGGGGQVYELVTIDFKNPGANGGSGKVIIKYKTV